MRVLDGVEFNANQVCKLNKAFFKSNKQQDVGLKLSKKL